MTQVASRRKLVPPGGVPVTIAIWLASASVALAQDERGLTSSAPAAGPVTVALWLFDEPLDTPSRALLEDWTINGYDLTLHAGARLVPGRFGNALEILGGSGRTALRRYIDPTPLNLGDSDWTWEFWLRMKAAARSGDVLFEMRGGPWDRGPSFGLAIGDTPGELLFTCEPSGIRQTLATRPGVWAAGDQAWHHVALAYASSDRRLMHWVDGELRANVVLPTSLKPLPATGENSLSVGADVSGWHPLPAWFDEMRVSTALVYEGTFKPPSSFGPPKEPLDLGPGPHLLIDDSLIAESSHLSRTTHAAQRLADPVIREREIRPGWTQQCGGFSVRYDPPSGMFRIWMCVKNLGFEEPDYYASTYWESSDGLHWRAPELGVLEFDGRRNHNIIMTGRTHNLRFHSDGLIDDGLDAPDPAKRYRIGYFPLDWRQDHTRGFNVAFSPDGIHWTPFEGNPVMRHWDVMDGHPGAGLSVADVNDLFYDEQRRVYVQTYKTYALPNEYPLSPQHLTDRWREVNDVVRGYRRLIGLCTSEDFIHWTHHQRIVVPDDADAPELQFYSFTIVKRGDLYVGHVRCLDDQAGKGGDGVGWMELATSRDLYHWTRHRDVFFDRNPKENAWDGAIVWQARPVLVGEETWFYYLGLGGGHKSGARHVGLARMRKDGYVSRDARGTEEGRLRTVAMRLPFGPGTHLTLNAQVQPNGWIKAQVLDAGDQVIEGYGIEACRPVSGDGVSLPLTWNDRQDVSSLAGKTIRLEFRLRDASLYGFEVSRGS
ncbi:MAG: hypothetical protein HY718_00415 [Planctomycetes bacterium]|nr:hypothetical protein [Planctomycetota bacterium]